MAPRLPAAERRARRRPWSRRLDRFATPLEPVEVLAALREGAETDGGLRILPAGADPLVLECATASGLRAQVRLDERTAGGSRVRCRLLDRAGATGADLDELRRGLRGLVERAEGRAASDAAIAEGAPNPYARTGWLPPEG